MTFLLKNQNTSWFFEHAQESLNANGRLFLKVFEQSRDLKSPFSKFEIDFFDRLYAVLSSKLMTLPTDWEWQEIDNLPKFLAVFDKIAKKQIRKPLNRFPIQFSALLYDGRGMAKGSVQSLVIKATNLSEGHFRIYDNKEIQEFYLNKLVDFETEAAE